MKNKGIPGARSGISARKERERNRNPILSVYDDGSGFADGRKPDIIDEMLLAILRQDSTPKLEGNSIGILNVQKRIKLAVWSKDFGLTVYGKSRPAA